MATFSLGAEQFLNLSRNPDGSGAPELPGEGVSVFQRPGIDGASCRRDGEKSQPFPMLSRVDVADLTAAAAKAAAYKALRGTLQTVVWGGVNFQTGYGVRYVVLEVQTTFRRIAASVGGLTANPQYLVEAVWVLLPVTA